MKDVCGLIRPCQLRLVLRLRARGEQPAVRVRRRAGRDVVAATSCSPGPRDLLGDGVFRRFGAEFPIRFDFLDTMGGGNLSLQVHPLTGYIRERFGIAYTQDESYYLMDAGPGRLGVPRPARRCGPAAMLAELEAAKRGGPPFDADRHVARWPARRHDHFLIPGRHHSLLGRQRDGARSERHALHLHLQAVGLGPPGPRRAAAARSTSLTAPRTSSGTAAPRGCATTSSTASRRWRAGDGWREERTGLHELEFIETRRHWFTGAAPHDTSGTVNVLNLVEGDEAVVESPDGAFEPFVVHYAETFVVPAAVGALHHPPPRPAGVRHPVRDRCRRRSEGPDMAPTDCPADRDLVRYLHARVAACCPALGAQDAAPRTPARRDREAGRRQRRVRAGAGGLARFARDAVFMAGQSAAARTGPTCTRARTMRGRAGGACVPDRLRPGVGAAGRRRRAHDGRARHAQRPAAGDRNRA